MMMKMIRIVLYLSSPSFPVLLFYSVANVPTASRRNFNIAYKRNTICLDHLF